MLCSATSTSRGRRRPRLHHQPHHHTGVVWIHEIDVDQLRIVLTAVQSADMDAHAPSGVLLTGSSGWSSASAPVTGAASAGRCLESHRKPPPAPPRAATTPPGRPRRPAAPVGAAAVPPRAPGQPGHRRPAPNAATRRRGRPAPAPRGGDGTRRRGPPTGRSGWGVRCGDHRCGAPAPTPRPGRWGEWGSPSSVPRSPSATPRSSPAPHRWWTPPPTAPARCRRTRPSERAGADR